MSKAWEAKVAIVTGGSRGLGLELSRELAAQGAKVVMVARDPEEIRRAINDDSFAGAEVVGIPADVSDPNAAREVIEQTKARFGSIDLIVNNAGIIQSGPLANMQLSDFQDSLGVHLWGPLYLSLAAMPTFVEKGAGRIVNISSIGGKIAVPHLLPYTAGKFALAGFSQGLRAEVARYGVKVTTVFPGLMRTGSPPNALFKGQAEKEYAWFAISDSLPGLTMDARRAARIILRAARHGKPHLVLGAPAKLAVTFQNLFPNLTIRGLGLVDRVLPRPTRGGNHAVAGRDAESSVTRRGVTRLSRRATRRNNETPRRPVQ